MEIFKDREKIVKALKRERLIKVVHDYINRELDLYRNCAIYYNNGTKEAIDLYIENMDKSKTLYITQEGYSGEMVIKFKNPEYRTCSVCGKQISKGFVYYGEAEPVVFCDARCVDNSPIRDRYWNLYRSEDSNDAMYYDWNQ